MKHLITLAVNSAKRSSRHCSWRRSPGSTELINCRKAFRFVPEKAWNAGEYLMLLSTDLEDISGNSVKSALDSFGGQAYSFHDPIASLAFFASGHR
jgi:hypothetical protein